MVMRKVQKAERVKDQIPMGEQGPHPYGYKRESRTLEWVGFEQMPIFMVLRDIHEELKQIRKLLERR